LFSPSRKQHNNKESLATDLCEWLHFEQSCFKTVFLRNSLQNVIKNNLCKVSRRRARDRDRNPSRPRPRPRRDLRPSRPRPRLQKTGLETHLETPSLTCTLERNTPDQINNSKFGRVRLLTLQL